MGLQRIRQDWVTFTASTFNKCLSWFSRPGKFEKFSLTVHIGDRSRDGREGGETEGSLMGQVQPCYIQLQRTNACVWSSLSVNPPSPVFNSASQKAIEHNHAVYFYGVTAMYWLVWYLTLFLFSPEAEGFLWQIIDSLAWNLNQEAPLVNPVHSWHLVSPLSRW